MPEPAVPPTPPVPLSALLAREDLALRQIAGPTDADTVIHWAHTSEMADPYPYLLGGELLLTAGVHIPEAAGSGTYFDDYVARIVAAGGAALGFGLAPVHDTVPRALVAACEAYELPLLEVPPQTTFSGVARAVWQLMARARLAELRRVTEAQQSLAAAASRPDPVRAVLRQLAQRVGGWAVLYGPEGAEVASAGRVPKGAGSGVAGRAPEGTASGPAARAPEGTASRPTAQAPEGTASRPTAQAPEGTASGTAARAPEKTVSGALAGLAEVVRPSGPGTPTSAADTASGVHLAAYALGAGQGFVLGVAAPQRDPGDHTIASVAAVLLSLLTGEHQSGSGAARSSALVRLLLGAEPQAVAPLLGAGDWLVVHALPDIPPCDPVAASALGAALGSPLVDLARDVVRVLVPADREPSPQSGWTLGVSAAAAAPDWPAADAQAARALSRAKATRTPLLRHGTHRPALTDLLSPDEAEAHARTLLAPLTTPLSETLRTWLSLHGSWDRTAVALSVHRNTVRQRIARCAALLGTDLDDPDVRMELWFALRHIER
ncbi:PucR family transcriptional regulator ligand-binding domain-containing protein [Streptomyces sp. AS02]|uniref:helix-turn-helix domain-containing protein n=1 Tax=Streptomyces sp. AS02 TaxID=2938946 RepID=UPI002020C585|nr:PucR family transcriptional regulator ligand-binding domain-containing protein [Streptomyces sp. AS02]MCL8012854.1 PucR family transcriptional regulator ligand-binding domain-containing protein [Streptomyces sp. AS02]